MATIAREVWLNMFEENLFDPSLQKIQQAIKDDSAFIWSGMGGGATVHIPNAGTAASITKDNDTYPVAAAKRSDVINSYNLSNFEVGPIVVQWKDDMKNAVEQTESILRDQIQGLGERVGREILYGQYHYTSGLYVPTTGANVSAHSPAATGTRKAFLGADLRTGLGIMDRTKVPANDRYLIIDTTMFWQLMTDIGYTAYRDQIAGLVNGMTFSLYGVTMIVLPQVLHSVVSTGAIREVTNAGATTDQAVALLVQKSCTSMAATDIFTNVVEAATGYFGGTYEASILAGGKYRRTDKYGVVPIIQAT